MSEATSGSIPKSIPDEQDVPAPRDSVPPLSAEEAERAASQFKPAWETSIDDASPPADITHEPIDEQVVSADEDKTQPPESAVTSPHPEPPADERIDDDQGPVDIIAAIPKRTEIVIKDEPSIVVPDDDPFDADASPKTAESEAQPDLQPSQRRTPVAVIAVVAVAAVAIVVGGIKLWSSDPVEPTQSTTSSRPAESATSVDTLPIAQEPVGSTSIQEPPPTVEPPIAPPPEPVVSTDTRQPPTKQPSAPTTVDAPPKPKDKDPDREPKPVTTATVAPEPKPPKPPKTSAPSPGTKAPPVIVRETPF